MDLNQLNFNSIIDKLQQDIESIKNDNKDLKIMVSSLNEQLESSKNDNKELKIIVSSLTSQMELTKSQLQTFNSSVDTNQQRLNQIITNVNSLPRKESIDSSYVKIEDHNLLVDHVRSIKHGQDNTKYKNTVILTGVNGNFESVIPIAFGGMKFDIELSPNYREGNMTLKFKKHISILSPSTKILFDFKLSDDSGINFVRFTKNQQIFDSKTAIATMIESFNSANLNKSTMLRLEVYIEVLSNNELKPIKAFF